MTGAEWLRCEDPARMLDAVPPTVGERKWRLFSCACCRRVWSLLHERASRRAVEVAERFADGDASPSTRADTQAVAWETWVHWPRIDTYGVKAAAGAAWVALPTAGPDEAATVLRYTLAAECRVEPDEALRDRCDLVRCVFGNPFHTVRADPAWRTGAVLRLAQAGYENGTFDQFSHLAEVLAEAGCTDAAVLGHCRKPGPHARGCWVVDLLLGKA